MTVADDNPDPELLLSIPQSEKIKRLSNMSEQDFRDKIVRPLFLMLGYQDGRELHGPDEQGKDILFIEEDKLGGQRIICVQTKKGKITMASRHSENIQDVITQLRMALNTRVSHLESRQQYYPHDVFLCTSGIINTNARNHIVTELDRDRRIEFLDAQSIVSLVDQKCPQLWQGISADIFAHYDAIRKHVEYNTSDVFDPGAANDATFVQLTFYREIEKPIKQGGNVRSGLEFEEKKVHDLIHQDAATVLIIGDAGSGKSTALWRVAYEIVRQDRGRGYRIPILIFSRDLSHEISSPEDLVAEMQRLSGEFSTVKQDLFQSRDIAEGRITLLVDGVDEIADTVRRNRLVRILCEFRNKYPRCSVIVTTRPDGQTKQYFREHRLKIYNVAPISWRQVRRIITQVLAARRFTEGQLESITSGAHNVLRQIEEVHGFQITPLLATVYAASADYSRSDIPANVTELFKKYTELMLGRWDEQKGLSQQYRAPLKDFILKKVSYEMHRNRLLYITRENFTAMVKDLLTERGHRLETQEIEDELLGRSRLLRVKREGVGFAHVLLQEFFAGRSMPANMVESYVSDSWWTKSIVFYYGENPEHAGHLRRVQKNVMQGKDQSTVSYRAIGLGLQAAYLSLLSDKVAIWLNVVAKLSELMVTYFEDSGQRKLFPLTEMTVSYLGLRDAVAFSSLSDKDVRSQVLEHFRTRNKKPDHDVTEAMHFWYVVALLESGFTEQAEDMLSRYKFRDLRYYLWIVMGAGFIEKILPVSREQKDTARRIRQNHEGHVRENMKELMREFHDSMLLEMKGERVVEVPDQADE